MYIDPKITVMLIGIVVIIIVFLLVGNNKATLPDKNIYYGLSAKSYVFISLLSILICALSLVFFTTLNPFFGFPMAILPVTIINIVYSRFRLSKTVESVRPTE